MKNFLIAIAAALFLAFNCEEVAAGWVSHLPYEATEGGRSDSDATVDPYAIVSEIEGAEPEDAAKRLLELSPEQAKEVYPTLPQAVQTKVSEHLAEKIEEAFLKNSSTENQNAEVRSYIDDELASETNPARKAALEMLQAKYKEPSTEAASPSPTPAPTQTGTQVKGSTIDGKQIYRMDTGDKYALDGKGAAFFQRSGSNSWVMKSADMFSSGGLSTVSARGTIAAKPTGDVVKVGDKWAPKYELPDGTVGHVGGDGKFLVPDGARSPDGSQRLKTTELPKSLSVDSNVHHRLVAAAVGEPATAPTTTATGAAPTAASGADENVISFDSQLTADYSSTSPRIPLNDEQKRVIAAFQAGLSAQDLTSAINMGEAHGIAAGSEGGVAKGIYLKIPTDPNWSERGPGPTLDILAIPINGGYRLIPYIAQERDREETSSSR